MCGLKKAVFAAVAAAALACTAVTPAAADVHGYYGHPHGWGFGHGLFGAVAALATLPIVIVSAAVSAIAQAPLAFGAEAYGGAPPAYYAPPPYYAPPAYYAPPPVYYPRAPVYYAAPSAYYAPRPVYYGAYAGRSFYGGGGYPYPRR
jgi:hypothetical protein